MKPQEVDALICGWSQMMNHSFTEEELNSLVDLIAEKLEAELVRIITRAEQDYERLEGAYKQECSKNEKLKAALDSFS